MPVLPPTSVESVNSIASLRAAPVPSGEKIILVEGFATSGDGGDGEFAWVSTATGDDGVTVVNPNSHSGSGRWVRTIPNDTLSVKAFGALGNREANDTGAFQKALDWQRASGGEIYIPSGFYNITAPLTYITAGTVHGLRMCGAGIGKSLLSYNFAKSSFLKIRGTESSQFMTGGYLRDFEITTPSGYGFFSQQAAIDVGNWIQFEIVRIKIASVRGHGIWAPTQYASVNNNTFPTVGVDMPNDKPWVYVDKDVATGRIAQLLARVKPAAGSDKGAITGFRIMRPGSGYKTGDAVHVTGAGQDFAGTLRTQLVTTGTRTSGSRTVTNVGTVEGVLVGNTVSGTGIPVDAKVAAVSTSPMTITLSSPATASATGATITIASPDGGIMGVDITDGGKGYYEDNDHLFDNPDPFTVGLATIRECQINTLDGIGVVLPHFASSGVKFHNNYIINCAQGGLFLGGNNNHVEGNSISVNGMHPTAGFFPGIWLCRTFSSPNNTIITTNELDSNTLCHILLDGTSSAKIYDNRFNSWVTFWTVGTNWTSQIPAAHIVLSRGNARCTNYGWDINRNAHRSQPVGASVPTSECSTVAGNTIISGIVQSPLASTTFIPGCRVEILDANLHPIQFSGGAPETTVTAVGLSTTGNLTAGSTTVSNVASTLNMVVDNPISGNGIPAGTTIVQVGSNTLTLSAPATVTATTVTFTVLGTLTLAAAPSATVADATVKVIINDEHVTWMDLGRDGQSSLGWIVDPVDNGNSKSYTRVANWRAAAGAGSQISYTDGTWRKIGNPGLGTAVGRIAAPTQVVIPANSTTLDILWTAHADPESRLEIVNGVPTGRYFTLHSGIFEVSGGLAVVNPSAGDLFTIRLMADAEQLLANGNPQQSSSIARELRYVAAGAPVETIPFSFVTPITSLTTWIGTNLPIQTPSAGEAGLIAWNPVSNARQRWTGSAWEPVAGTSPVPFDSKSALKVQILTNRANPIDVYSSTSYNNWCSFKQIG